MIFTVLLFPLGCGPKPPKNVGVQINIEVVDDDSGLVLNGANIIVNHADGNSEQFTTNQNGQITLHNVYKFPLTLAVDNGKTYNTKKIEIRRGDINENLSSRQKIIRLEPRKTIIYGRVVDIDTGTALPSSAGLVTISTEPPSDMTLTDRSGAYEIGSTDFEQGVIIAVRAQLPGKYEENTKTVEITKYWDRNKVPTIALKKLIGWEPPALSDDSIKVIDQPTTGKTIVD